MQYRVDVNTLIIEKFYNSRQDYKELNVLFKQGNFEGLTELCIAPEAKAITICFDVDKFWKQFNQICFPSNMLDINLYKVYSMPDYKRVRKIRDAIQADTITFTAKQPILSKGIYTGNKHVKRIIVPRGITEISTAAFEGCSNLEAIDLPPSLTSLGYEIFEGCNKLKNIYWEPAGAFRIQTDTFTNIDSKINVVIAPTNKHEKIYIDSDFSDSMGFDSLGNVHLFDSAEPGHNYKKKAKLDDIEACFNTQKESSDEEYHTHYFSSDYMVEYKLYELLKNTGVKFSIERLGELETSKRLDKFIDDCDFKAFANDVWPLVKHESERYENFSSIFYLAELMGCFSKEPYIVDGKQSKCTIGQKASSLLARLFKSHAMPLRNLETYLKCHDLNVKYDQRILTFLGCEEADGVYPNVELLLHLENKYSGIMEKVLCNFEEASLMRHVFLDNGRYRKRTWEEALEKFFVKELYDDVDPEHTALAEYCAKRGLSSNTYKAACKVYNSQKVLKTPSHILKVALKEKTIVEEIEEIKRNTASNLEEAYELTQKAIAKKFTYEMLDKHSLDNYDIGGEIDGCCCTLDRPLTYGFYIASAAITEYTVQHMVVRDCMDNIVGKGTMYVDVSKGYIVINDFEIAERYRAKHEGEKVGNVEEENRKYEDRTLIFNAFRRGLKAFMEEYNKEYLPHITQINVGLGYNKLKDQLVTYPRSKNRLKVPEEYRFEDTYGKQVVLYQKK